MCQLTQRVVLIHKLRQLGRTKKFFHGCRHRFNIDQRLWGNTFQILCCHSFTNNSFQSGKPDTILVLKQFPNCTDTTIAQVIDVIIMTNAVFQMHIIVDRSKNVFFCNMFRNQLMDIFMDGILNILIICIFFQYFLQYRIIY